METETEAGPEEEEGERARFSEGRDPKMEEYAKDDSDIELAEEGVGTRCRITSKWMPLRAVNTVNCRITFVELVSSWSGCSAHITTHHHT